jgi:hypothetical protein
MEGPVNVYAIYYGDWSNESAGKAILANLFTNIGNTSYYKIQQTYTNAAGTPLSVTISFKGGVTSGIDAMASLIINELEEAHSDPFGTAWFDSSGYENADKCVWTYGTLYTASNGAKYNVVVGSKQYLLQQNWLNVGRGSCAMASNKK